MKQSQALVALSELTAYQWGMVTTAQAQAHGITRLDLSRLTRAGHLRRLSQGVYLDAGAPGDEFESLRAAWLSTDPERSGPARLGDGVDGVVVAGASAAHLHAIGDLWADRHEFATCSRRQSQRPEIHYRQLALDPHDVTVVEGLPTMTLERTIADLVDSVGDRSLVADAIRDAANHRDLDLARLRELLAPLARRHGHAPGDGQAFLNQLLTLAERDPDSVARRISADPILGPRVVENYLERMSPDELARLFDTKGTRAALTRLGDWARGQAQTHFDTQEPPLRESIETFASRMRAGTAQTGRAEGTQ